MQKNNKQQTSLAQRELELRSLQSEYNKAYASFQEMSAQKKQLGANWTSEMEERLVAIKADIDEWGDKAKKLKMEIESEKILEASATISETIDGNGMVVSEDGNIVRHPSFDLPQGHDSRIFLMVQKGRPFNPNSGALVNRPQLRIFALGEMKAYLQMHARLGEHIARVLYNPYNKVFPIKVDAENPERLFPEDKEVAK